MASSSTDSASSPLHSTVSTYSPSTILQRSWDTFAKAEKEHLRIEKKATASQDERDYALAAKEAAREAVNDVIKVIKAQPLLTLHTVEEAKTFAKLVPTRFQDRERLKQVAIGNVGGDTKRKIWQLLETAGLKVEQEEFTFKF